MTYNLFGEPEPIPAVGALGSGEIMFGSVINSQEWARLSSDGQTVTFYPLVMSREKAVQLCDTLLRHLRG